jgi:hypothetical protein
MKVINECPCKPYGTHTHIFLTLKEYEKWMEKKNEKTA